MQIKILKPISLGSRDSYKVSKDPMYEMSFSKISKYLVTEKSLES